jgi:hypothetical protein
MEEGLGDEEGVGELLWMHQHSSSSKEYFIRSYPSLDLLGPSMKSPGKQASNCLWEQKIFYPILLISGAF